MSSRFSPCRPSFDRWDLCLAVLVGVVLGVSVAWAVFGYIFLPHT